MNDCKKILFVAVFDDQGISTNNSQARALESLGHHVYRYNFREKEHLLGSAARNADLIEHSKTVCPDLVIFSKCCEINLETIKTISDSNSSCYWFMDPPSSVTKECVDKAAACDYSAIAWKGSMSRFETAGCSTFYVPEGFDEAVDTIVKEEKSLSVSFIGSLHTNRLEILSKIRPPVAHITNAFGINHSHAVGASKINISISTNGGASDRVFKVLAAGGFLITDDFIGLDEMFEDGKDLVVFKNTEDLQRKIDWYLKNEEERSLISSNGHKTVQKYNRVEWAKRVVSLRKDFLLKRFSHHSEDNEHSYKEDD